MAVQKIIKAYQLTAPSQEIQWLNMLCIDNGFVRNGRSGKSFGKRSPEILPIPGGVRRGVDLPRIHFFLHRMSSPPPFIPVGLRDASFCFWNRYVILHVYP
ncbi:hypothetical protein HOLleu_29629 [Holothuria leucospilota]|uniref:Uncharacterized protein n=1 Tax=Holothuria leucospilota TaxID=206669 RepID=A0A9Q1BNU8_HOLLE|nr:hypothetical protein HOLleu_29629 [Holothuria leucospilota]